MKIVTDSANYAAIASAIRAVKKDAGTMLPREMAAAISSISAGVELNVDYGASEPLDTSKLWVPRNGKAPSAVIITDECDEICDSMSESSTFTGPYAVNTSAVEVGGKIYVIGCSTAPTRAVNLLVRVFDPESGTFSEISGAQTERSVSTAGAASVGGVIYSVGGSTYKDYMSADAQFYDTVVTYDTGTKKSGTFGAVLPYAMAKTTAVSCGGSIYVMGGIRKDGGTFENVSAVYRVDVSAGTVTKAGDGIPGFAPECCAAVGERIYCFGTSTPMPDKSSAVAAFWVYDVKSGTSALIDCACPDFYGSCCCAVDGRVYVFCRDGGVYTADAGGMTRCPSSMAKPTEGACCASVGGKAYVFGGYEPYAANNAYWTSPQRVIRTYAATAKLPVGTMKIAVGGSMKAAIIKSEGVSVSVPVFDVRFGGDDGVSAHVPAFVYRDGWQAVG